MSTFKEHYFKTPGDWQHWLSIHFGQEESIWLILPKKNNPAPGLLLEEAIEEALCWGWIDSTPGKVDTHFYKVRFSKRSEKSNWSGLNKRRIAKLEKEERLQAPGLQMIRKAKASGTWAALDEVEKGIVLQDLAQAFAAYKGARENFEAFPTFTKRAIQEWILNAKRPDTRAKRIAETANERPRQFSKK